MLVIRLQRTGRKNLPAYRIVVAEKARAVKKQFIDIVGHYLPAQDPKVIEIDLEKVKEWISKGAQPSDTVAALCKSQGLEGMEKYMEPRNKQKKKKNEAPEEEAPAAPAQEEAPASDDAPEAEPETPAEQTDVEDGSPKAEAAPADEAAAPEPETPAEEPAPETTSSDEPEANPEE